MGARSKLPRLIKSVVAALASNCPICGHESQDRRYKKRLMRGFVLTNRRITYRTVTRECRVCDLRFSFTWKTFINALRKKAELEKNPKNKELMLDKAQNIEDILASGLTFEEIRDRIETNKKA